MPAVEEKNAHINLTIRNSNNQPLISPPSQLSTPVPSLTTPKSSYLQVLNPTLIESCQAKKRKTGTERR